MKKNTRKYRTIPGYMLEGRHGRYSAAMTRRLEQNRRRCRTGRLGGERYELEMSGNADE